MLQCAPLTAAAGGAEAARARRRRDALLLLRPRESLPGAVLPRMWEVPRAPLLALSCGPAGHREVLPRVRGAGGAGGGRPPHARAAAVTRMPPRRTRCAVSSRGLRSTAGPPSR